MSPRSRQPAGLDAPVLSYRARARVWADQETYHVLLHDAAAVEWAQIATGYGRETCVQDLSNDQYPEAIAVYCSHDGRFDDVSEDIAGDVLNRLIDRGHATAGALPRLVSLHLDNAAAILDEARRNAGWETSHMRLEREAARS